MKYLHTEITYPIFDSSNKTNTAMKTFIVNIESQTVTINGQSCNFYEAGLTDNRDPLTTLTNRAEIIEVLQDREEEDEITVIFEGEKLADTLAVVETEITAIIKHFTALYAEEIVAGKVNGDVVHEWWGHAKDQYSDAVTFEEIEKAIAQINL